MNEQELIEKTLREPRITQKAPAYPIFVVIIEGTFLHLGKYLDSTYSGCIFEIENGFGDLSYLENDFPKVLGAIEAKIKKSPNFLRSHKALYDKEFREAWSKYQKASKGTDVIDIFAFANNLMMISVGAAHVIEPISILGTHELKDQLTKTIKDPRESSRVLNTLTTPEKKSFSNKYDDSLAKISKEADESIKEKLIEKHLKDYYWIKNSYAGSRKLTRGDVLEELKSLRKDNRDYFKNLKRDKQIIIKKYNIGTKIQKLAERLLFITSWQDQRKINILKAITELDKTLYKISQKFNVGIKGLYLMMPEEILAKKFLTQEEIDNREKCFLWVCNLKLKNHHIVLSGERAENLYKKFTVEEKSGDSILNGMCASTGSAIGRASICKTLEDIKNFKSGDILVTSMTRPEYLPAMKKAAAIVTDEGGITCHAAIVSRELGIPCVIGTKNATTMIQNGDLVEVKADHGAVKILK